MLPIRRMPLVVVVFFTLTFLPLTALPEDPLPSRLSDEAFWKLVSDLSEPDGAFISDNFVSNERSFQHVLPDLSRDHQPASAYIGVGPEQNFTYILALKPQIAFIVDIRRQNLVVHLMYKALFELSADRAEFLSRLFSRARPENLSGDTRIDVLLHAFRGIPADPQIFEDNLKRVKQRLTVDHGFKLTIEDEAGLEKVLEAFGRGANNLSYNGPVAPGGILPTFDEMMQETDKEGIPRGFLSTEAGFRALKEFQGRNLVVPVVGDFAGSHALRSVGQYLRDHGATVTSFYTSNVEQYLFLNKVFDGFYANVSTLPLSAKSVFIRGLIVAPNGEYSASPAFTRTSRFETQLFSIPDLVQRFAAGTIEKYNEILSGVPVR
jgi:hypothetical protein